MRRGDFSAVCTVLGILVTSPLLWAQADANGPWDPNAHLVVYPRTCQLSAEYHLPEDGEPVWMSVDRRIGLSARIAVPDPNGLIGLSRYPVDVVAWDEFGTVLEPTTIRNGPVVYVPLAYASTIHVPEMTWTVDPQPHDVSLDLQVAYDATSFPVSLSRVEWSTNALLSDQFEMVDLPFAPTDGWVEIVPGLEVLIEEATISDDSYQCNMQTRFDPDRIAHSDGLGLTIEREEGYLWLDQMSPELIVIALEVVDAEGNAVRYQGGAGVLSISRSKKVVDGLTIITRHETGSCDACGQAAFLRHTIAYAPYEQEVRLVLEDVTLPAQQ